MSLCGWYLSEVRRYACLISSNVESFALPRPISS